ncbi:K02A2.6-like [Cordylochernes scorpioides]|uniref:K02A2.6-like n=1 Tax=Cordylochernes scorpioides TaxID=51811 RepID=A0ABY6L427_9ARAC|nr:K02A2.6-like [Cordylochernes scorpioides]
MSKLEGSIENLTNIDNAERPVEMENISSCISPELPPSHKIELLELLERFSELFNPITKDNYGRRQTIKKARYRIHLLKGKLFKKSPLFCVDYRGLNKVTKKDAYPLPRVDDALDCLKGAKICFTMDLKSGYWQNSFDETDREKTAFITPDGLFKFKAMPFGLYNAPAKFERMMDGLLKGLRWTICLCYLDDVVVFADNFSNHLARIEAVLNCFKKVGLRLNPSKCSFGVSKIKILGHQVDQNGFDQTSRRLRQSPNFQPLITCSRRFIRNYADIARPLNALLSKGTKFDPRGAFRKLKIASTLKTVLGHFDDDAPTELHTDVSGYGIGAVLAQKPGSDEKVIAYASRTLLRAEQNYSTTEREYLAIIWAIGKFRPYFCNRPPFLLLVDHLERSCWQIQRMPGHRKRRQFRQTDAFARGMVIGLKRAGWFIRQIAADTHLGASTVHRLWRRWLEQGNVAIYRNVGATRVTSARVDRRILRQAVAAPQATCTAILQHVQDTLDHSISTRTISRRLVANGLHSCRPLRRLPLTPPNRRQRLE